MEHRDSTDEATAGRKPNIEHLAEAFKGPLGVRSLALTGLFILALFYTIHIAKEVFLPIVLALLLNFLLSPVVRTLRRTGIPEPIAAALILILFVGGLAGAAYNLASPVSDWLARAPQILRKVERQVREIRKPVEKVTQATEQVEKLTDSGAPRVPTVAVQSASFAEVLLNQTWSFFLGAVVMMILLYFLLASGDLFLRKVVTVLPRFEDKKRAVQIAHQIEENISIYLVSVTAINAGLGVVVSIAMWLLGMPTPWLWGAMAGLFNFVPYLGAIASASVIGLVASATFDGIGQTIAPPATFLVITSIEGNLVTPAILGRRLTLNPVVIFVSLILWGWIWGIAGALLAVPILAVFKLFCDNIEPLSSIGEFLGD